MSKDYHDCPDNGFGIPTAEGVFGWEGALECSCGFKKSVLQEDKDMLILALFERVAALESKLEDLSDVAHDVDPIYD